MKLTALAKQTNKAVAKLPDSVSIDQLRALSRRRDRFIAEASTSERRFDGTLTTGDALRLPPLAPRPPEALLAAIERVLASSDPDSAIAGALRKAQEKYASIAR